MQDVKEYMYSQCQDLFDFSNVPDHLMNITTAQKESTEVENSTNCIPDRSKVIFNDFIKERLGETPARHFLEPLKKCKVSTFGDMKKALTNERIGS